MKLTEKIEVIKKDNIKFLSSLPDKCYDLGCTDIPYGIGVGNMAFIKETKTTVTQKNGNKLNPNKNKKLKPADWDNETPSQKWFDEFCRVTKHQIFFGSEYVNYKGMGKGRIKWNKGVAEGMSFKPYEEAYCSFIDYTHEINYLWAGMMQGKSISEPMTQQGNKKLNEKRLHPTQKPVILWDIIFKWASKIIEIKSVIDTNCGLSSQAISADKFGFNWTGLDLHEPYYLASIERIKNHVSQQKLF